MPVQHTTEEIREKYERASRWYEFVDAPLEMLGVRRLRRDLLRHAAGQVLEVAVGTGANLPLYPPGLKITAVDLSPAMLGKARKKAEKIGLRAVFSTADAENLPFENESFDTVVSSMSLCTFPDPVRALREMGRVCKADGRILLLEHGRSSRRWIGDFQDRHAERHARQLGCHWNREPPLLVRIAGLRILSGKRNFMGIFYRAVVTPQDFTGKDGG